MLTSFCSESLMCFAYDYLEEVPDLEVVSESLSGFVVRCISAPLGELVAVVDSPTFIHELARMIDSYNWYINNRFWGFQLFYPVVSFLRVFYAIALHNSDVDFLRHMLETYAESVSGEML